MALEVLFEDGHLIAVNKPAGIPVQPDRSGDRALLDEVHAHLSDQGNAHPTTGPIHRLDRPVSGAVMFAVTAEALSRMNLLFRQKLVEKRYWVIAHGALTGAGEMQGKLVEDARARKARVVGEGSEAETLTLRWQALVSGDRYTLLEVTPREGHFHQIRALLAHAGHPIRGDVKYGARRGERDRSIALHARSLRFTHPFSGAPILIEAPAPGTPVWQAFLQLMPRT